MSTPGFDAAGVTAQAALAASGHAFSVGDAREPDFPLTWVNAAFTELTGYTQEDVVGRNCRFLKGPDTDPAAATRLRKALETGRTITETLVNYRKDGSSWWNRVIITPVHDDAGELTHFVGVQSNVDNFVYAARQRDDARAAAGAAEARQYASEHELTLALQRSLLPTLPVVDGLQLAARYLPASESAEVGGDWYDVLPLPGGSTGIAIGDVMGHDLHAAASMGQLRSVVRSYAWEGYGPAEVLDRLNYLVHGLGMARLATSVYARLEPAHAGQDAMLRWANAGHPPPMLRTPDGAVELLTDASSVLIGATLGSLPAMNQRPEAQRAMPSGSTLLLYTDGLVEDRSRDIDEGIETLRTVFAGTEAAMGVDDLAGHVITECHGGGNDDDTCLLIVRLD